MKKAFMFFAVVALLASTSFAQMDGRLWGARNINPMMKTSVITPSLTHKAAPTMATSLIKAVGDTISNFPWNESFDATTAPVGFTFIDNDGDGYGWDYTYWNVNGGTITNSYSHSGDGMIASASYINSVGALTPDNWMILPTIAIPTNASDFTLSWYEADYQYPESYVVYITNTGRAMSDFTATTPVASFSTNTQSVVFVKRTIDLSSYAGQTINIAFRHYNVTDQYWLFIDDMRIGGVEAPEVTIAGPTSIVMGTAATFTATGASSFTWSVDGATQSATGNTLTYTFTTTGNHSVVAEASNAAGSDSDTLYVNVYSCDEAITTMPWEDDLEGVTDCWHFVVNNDSSTAMLYPNSQYAHSGNNFIALINANDATGVSGDTWAISPKLTIPNDATPYTLSYYIIIRTSNNVHSAMEVRLSDGSADTTDFTTLLYTDTTSASYDRHIIDIPNTYAGQTIRVAFRNITANNGPAVQIDDIRLGGMELPELEVEGPVTVIAGNAVTYVAHSDVSTLSWEVNGTLQSSTTDTLVYTFPAAGSYTVKVGATNAAGTAYDSLMVTAVECNAITSFPYNENFEMVNPCWQFVSIDPANDGNSGITDDESFQGNYAFALSSYRQASDYNQYLISPEFTLPATGQYMVKFWYMGYDASDAFRVLASTTTADINAFTEVLADYPTVATDWTEAGFILPEGTKYVAINYYGNYAYYLYIDSVTIESLTAPTASIEGPVSGKVGYNYTFSAITTVAETYAWTVDGNAAGNGQSLTYAFAEAGNHTIGLTVSNSVGNATATPLTINIVSCDAQSLPYVANFSNGIDICWDSEGWDTLSGNGTTYVYSMSAQSVLGLFMMDLHQDNWLISEPLTMGANGGYSIKWNAFTYTADYPSDHYAVYVISGNDTTQLFAETLTANDATPQQRSIAIPAAITGEFKIAFRHYECEGGYVLLLNDIKVVDPTGIDDVNIANVSIYPNPASEVLNIEGEGIQMVEMFDMNGRNVLTSMTAGQISLTSLVNGVYVVRVTTDNGIRTEKIVKK